MTHEGSKLSTTTQEFVLVLPGVLDSVKKRSQHEKEKGGYEAVGFLAKKKHTSLITSVMPLVNHASDPQKSYFVEPWTQFRAEQKLAANGYDIVGVYHSHPNGEARPSRTDEILARPGELMLIYSVVFDEIKCWRESDGKLVPVELIAP